MLDPYKMIVINVLALSFCTLGFLFYRFIYPKKNVSFLTIIVILGLILSLSVFRKGIYESGDFTIHLYRTISFFDSLSEGIFMPSWSSNLNANYGYPLFIFNYTLPYYLLSFIHFLGFSYIFSMKLFLAANIILSGIFMYLFSKKILKNDLAAFSSSVFYLFAPYHLIDIHFKIVIGEILLFTLLPLYFIFLQKMVEGRKIHILTSGLLLSLLIMSHVVIAFFVTMLSTMFVVIVYKKKILKSNLYLKLLLSYLLGALSSIYLWLPPFFLSKFTIYEKAIENHVLSLSLKELLYSPWRLGLLFQGPYGEISNLIGYPHVIILGILCYLLLRHKLSIKYNKSILFWLFSTFVLIYLITNYSDFIWYQIPFVRNVGNHRLLLLTAFTCSVLAGYFTLAYKKKPIIYLLLAIAILSTVLNWGQRRVLPSITDADLIKSLPESTARGEGHYYANSRWADKDNPWFLTPPRKPLEIVSGKGILKEISRTSTMHTYITYSDKELSLRENTMYFPGWIVKVNGKETKISYENNSLINFSIHSGINYIEVTYNDVPLYKIIKQISFATFFSILLFLFFYYGKILLYNPKRKQ
ncbi:MAG: hypothetical protein HZC02_02305 [Candidatus Levybacteria bacterium]|nr:hypothetical protein [Candidatus Levybacteria bacterium]